MTRLGQQTAGASMQLSFEIDGSLPKPARRAVRPQSPVLSASPLIHEKKRSAAPSAAQGDSQEGIR
jgi:hypothetical protein